MTRGPRRSPRVLPALVCLATMAFAGTAAAQQAEPRYQLWFSGGAQAAMPPLGDRFTFEMHAEGASVEADHRATAALLVDGGFAVRLRRAFGIGVSVSRFSGSGRAAVAAQIPNPFEFDKFREVSGTASGLDHTELAYHVQLRYSRAIGRRLRLVLAGGPTAFDVRRELVTDVQVDEAYPFDTATFRNANTRAAKGTGIGFHAGADIVWMAARQVGVGALVRYARGAADVKGPSRTVSVDTGGLQIGVGLRMYF